MISGLAIIDNALAIPSPLINCHLHGEMWQFFCGNIQSQCERCMVRIDMVWYIASWPSARIAQINKSRNHWTLVPLLSRWRWQFFSVLNLFYPYLLLLQFFNPMEIYQIVYNIFEAKIIIKYFMCSNSNKSLNGGFWILAKGFLS